jgi:four helix bundle protein
MGYGLWAMGAPNWYNGSQIMLHFLVESTGLVLYRIDQEGLFVGDFKKLEVWQVAHQVARDVYRETAGFPKTEAYGLTAQLRRSAASIPANLAEGSGRRGDVEFSRFVRISLGSATELEYHLLLSHDIGFLPSAPFEGLTTQVVRVQNMLAGLHRTLKKPCRNA